MATNVEKLREKLEQLKNPGSGKFSRKTWKPKKGGEKSKIRLIDYPFSEDNFVELWFHYGIGNGPGILCLNRNYGRSCPICDFARSLNDTGEEKDKELAKTLWPKQRVYAVVIDREDSKPTPKYWGFGVQVYTKLIESLLNSQTGHMLNTAKGIDMTIWSEKKNKKMFPETDFI